MAVELVTIERVPILRVGTYDISTGTRTFTEEDLRDAQEAWANDPAVKNPRVRIASLAQALDLDPGEHGGEPAFGYLDNLVLSEDGQELYADWHVPPAIRDGMTWAYPSLSIEGPAPGWTSSTGRSYGLVITAVALLGVHWPGCTTLEDFMAQLSEGPAIETSEPEEVLATMPQRAAPPAASLDHDLVVRRFLEAIDGGDLELPEGVSSSWSLWVRSMRFDDDGNPYLKVTDEDTGTLYRVDFTVAGNDVNFGDFTEVVEQDVPVAAGAARPAAPLATYATREQFRAVAATTNDPEEGASMTDEQRRTLAERHGLDPETATEAEVLDAVMAADQGGGSNENEGGEPGGEGGAPEANGGAPANTPEPVAASSRTVPEGMVLVDGETWAAVQAGARAGAELAERDRNAERDRTVQAAVQEGRIPPARAAHYQGLWDADPEGTRHLLTASPEEGGLAPNTIPVAARGAEPQDKASAAGGDAAHDRFMETHFPKVRAGRGHGGRVRHRQEV